MSGFCLAAAVEVHQVRRVGIANWYETETFVQARG